MPAQPRGEHHVGWAPLAEVRSCSSCGSSTGTEDMLSSPPACGGRDSKEHPSPLLYKPQSAARRWFAVFVCAGAVFVCAELLAVNRGTWGRHDEAKASSSSSSSGGGGVDWEEQALQAVVGHCARRTDDFIYLGKGGRVRTAASFDQVLDDGGVECPVMDVMLRGSERGVGMCTDVALYVVFWGARILPLDNFNVTAYTQLCTNKTARLFLETLYSEYFSSHPGAVHVMLPNHEHLMKRDLDRHARMDAFLCKTRACAELVPKYVAAHHMKAKVWYAGHTSLDPSVNVDPSVTADYNEFIHVRGKSGLKHTEELLQCWGWSPDFPRLTVLGDMTMSEGRYKRLKSAGNIRFIPKPWLGHRGKKDEDFRNISTADVHQLQVSSGVHLCTSEREGFGHYINEARAVGALVVAPDHPPMNELVTPQSGIMVQGDYIFSHDFAALAPYGNISVHLSARGICKAMEAALRLLPEERAQLGKAARAAFLHDRRQFMDNIKTIKGRLLQMLDRHF